LINAWIFCKMLELKGVSKQYLYGANLFGNLDMQINSSEIISVLGEAGSGKTTLLKMMSACTDYDGQILLDGQEIKTKTNDIIMVFDDLALFENKTYYFNLAYPLLIRGYSKEEIDFRVNKVATKLGIVACLKDKVKKSNLLDIKRLGIARIFLRDAKLILIDDITAGLDKQQAKLLWDEIMPYLVEKSNEGVTIVYSTTDSYEAKSISDRIAVIHYGELKQFDTYDNIIEKPNNIWSIEKLANDYHFEKATLRYENDKLNIVFEENYAVDASIVKNKIYNGYIDKNIYVGWKTADYLLDSDRKEKVLFSIKGNHGYYLKTETNKLVYSKEKREIVGTLPMIEKVSLFDYENENNIIK